MISKPDSSLCRATRLLLAALAGYAFAAGLAALIAAALPRLSMARTESATLGGMLAVLACLAVILWVVATTRLVRTLIIVVAASAILIVTASSLAAG